MHLCVFDDCQVACGTYNRDIAMATMQLVQKEACGIYHCVGPNACSKYQWAHNIVSISL